MRAKSLYTASRTLTVLALLITLTAGSLHAQDSARKAKPAPVKIGIKPPARPVYYSKPKPAATAQTTQPAPNTPATQPAVTRPVTPAPVADPALLNDKSLNGQYQYLLTRVYHYQQPLISALWKNFSDTLNSTRRKLADVSAKLNAQSKKADTLQTQLNANEQVLSQSNARVDQVSLLGIPVTKATYNWIMWGLVVAFGAIAAIVVARSASYNREAKYRIKLYDELDEEFKNYKVKANEKEKKLARELQTERNKLDELMGRG